MSRKMKDSGIEWIGEIPEDWEVVPQKHIMTKLKIICNEYNDEDIISLTKSGVIVRDLVNPFGKMPASFDGYQYVYKGNLLTCLFDIDVTPRCTGLIKNDGLTSPAYSQFVLKNGHFADFYNYYLLMIDYDKIYLHLSKNLRSTISENDFGFIHSIRPPYHEQQKIANFLDKKVAEIDHILERTRESIEEYKKYKQSIITEAVTKGLNSDVKMKDSGIEWIGEIPREWEVTQLKRFSSICNGKEIKVEVDKNDKENSKIVSVYGSGGIFKYTNDFLHNGESVLFGRKGTIGKPMYVNERFWTVDTMYFMKFKSELEPKYCYYYLTFYPWDTIMTKTALPSVVGTDVGNSQFAFPSKEEQLQIISYLDDKCNEIDNLISQKEQLLSDLESYKKSLIYECVTGKREVV